MGYDNIDSAEMAEMALAQAVDEHIEKSQEVIDRISDLEKSILQWDQEDIKQLRTRIKEMRILLQKHFQVQIENFINMKAIPGSRVPEDIKQAYKIVAVDKKGVALYGPEMDKITYFAKITEHYQKKRSSSGIAPPKK